VSGDSERADFGPDFVPRRRGGVAGADFDGELVLYDGETEQVAHLDRLASAVWQCIDGEGTLVPVDPEVAGGRGVMIGRASQGRPWIFAELRGMAPPNEREIALLAYRHSAMNCDWYGKRRAMLAMRSQLLKYFEGFACFGSMRPGIVKLETLDDLRLLILKHLGFDPAAYLQSSSLSLKAA
jgi:tRNA-dihydrouridine synthase